MPKKRIDPKEEAGRVSVKMTDLGFESVFSKVVGQSVFMLWVRGSGDNVMTCSSARGTKYFRLVDVQIT